MCLRSKLNRIIFLTIYIFIHTCSNAQKGYNANNILKNIISDFFVYFYIKYIIMNPILTRIDKIVIDLFKSLYDKISDLRVVKRTNIKDNMNVCYNIEHLFHVVLNYCFSDSPINNCIPEGSNLRRLCKSSLSYWLGKVYSIDYVYSFYKIIYNISKNFPKTYFIRSDDILTNIINRYNVYACDGTSGNLNQANKNGKSCSSFELSILLDISNNMIYDYSFCFDCNETNALLNTALFKKRYPDIISMIL